MDAFHIQGSRILSRSFTVPLHRFGRSHSQSRSDGNSEKESDDEDEEEMVVMIPFADMLNAAWGRIMPICMLMRTLLRALMKEL